MIWGGPQHTSLSHILCQGLGLSRALLGAEAGATGSREFTRVRETTVLKEPTFCQPLPPLQDLVDGIRAQQYEDDPATGDAEQVHR